MTSHSALPHPGPQFVLIRVFGEVEYGWAIGCLGRILARDLPEYGDYYVFRIEDITVRTYIQSREPILFRRVGLVAPAYQVGALARDVRDEVLEQGDGSWGPGRL